MNRKKILLVAPLAAVLVLVIFAGALFVKWRHPGHPRTALERLQMIEAEIAAIVQAETTKSIDITKIGGTVQPLPAVLPYDPAMTCGAKRDFHEGEFPKLTVRGTIFKVWRPRADGICYAEDEPTW